MIYYYASKIFLKVGLSPMGLMEIPSLLDSGYLPIVVCFPFVGLYKGVCVYSSIPSSRLLPGNDLKRSVFYLLLGVLWVDAAEGVNVVDWSIATLTL